MFSLLCSSCRWRAIGDASAPAFATTCVFCFFPSSEEVAFVGVALASGFCSELARRSRNGIEGVVNAFAAGVVVLDVAVDQSDLMAFSIGILVGSHEYEGPILIGAIVDEFKYL